METVKLSEATRSLLFAMQTNELTEYYIYSNIAKFVKDAQNKEILERIAQEEKVHAGIWQEFTGVQAKPKKGRIFWFSLLARVFGYTFALKLMESGENEANAKYEDIAQEVPQASQIAADEMRHENELLALLNEERLQYVGSMMLGLSDALVELGGTLAGLTFALQNTKIIALSGLITGISATLSMASSEYLSSRSEGGAAAKNALKSGIYTGVVYLLTVIMMVLPYLLFPAHMYMYALGITLCIIVVIIAVFNYYIAVATEVSFKKRFIEMAGISLTVIIISFGIGILVKKFLGLDI